jgi:hypothetical protein
MSRAIFPVDGDNLRKKRERLDHAHADHEVIEATHQSSSRREWGGAAARMQVMLSEGHAFSLYRTHPVRFGSGTSSGEGTAPCTNKIDQNVPDRYEQKECRNAQICIERREKCHLS